MNDDNMEGLIGVEYESWDDYHNRRGKAEEKAKGSDYSVLIQALVGATEEGIPHEAQAIANELNRRADH